jgi:hypothetical protein
MARSATRTARRKGQRMSINAAPGQGLSCPHCGSGYEPGDQYCQGCGQVIAVVPAQRGGQRRHMVPIDNSGSDGPTRYLCAAAHLDPEFADAAIGEYLIEPTRAVPSSVGVDSAAVLRDAVAARFRRRVRDGVLLALALLFVVTSPALALLWLVVSVSVALTGAAKRALSGILIIVAVGAVALILAFTLIPSLTFLLYAWLDSSSSIAVLLTMFLGVLIVGVLLTDELIVTDLTRSRFLSGQFVADAKARPGWELFLRTLGHAQFEHQLTRVADTDRRRGAQGQTEVTVYRGWRPFLGAGVPIHDRAYPLPLKPAESDEDGGGMADPRAFTVLELQNYLAGALADLRSSQSLVPSRRFSQLSICERVFIPVEQLIRNRNSPNMPPVLDDLGYPPMSHLPSQEARWLADAPQESARYYQCFAVEAWDRDLIVSCFVTAGTDNSTLYLEWTHCVLFPVDQRYRGIDEPDEFGPIQRALQLAVGFPASLLGRLASVMHRFRPIRERRGVIVPARYGASFSLRERAAQEKAHNYFQDADALRYMAVLEQALFRATGKFLEAHGYSVRDVLDIAKQNVTHFTTNIANSTLNNSAVGGRDASAAQGGSGSNSPGGTQ